jgi:hypothetical protein
MFGSILYNLRTTVVNAGASANAGRIAAEEVTLRLESRLDYLELACAGLWELLKQRHGYSDEELVAAIQAVDARDGTSDGKIGRASRTCPNCQRKLLTRDSPKCSWCGADLPSNLF